MPFRNFLLALGALFVVAGLALAVIWLRQIASSPVASSEPGTPGAAETPAPGKLSALAAMSSLSSGTLLRPGDIGWKDIKPGEVRPGLLLRGQASETELLGSVTRREFADGEALIASELVMPGDRRFLAAVLKPGLRAASISVDAPQTASGLVLPGDRVDVILTQNFTGALVDPTRKSVGETVLRNLRVVAVGPSLGGEVKPASTETAAPAAEPSIPKTVTLELSERQAEALFVASQIGALALSVRPLEGSVVVGMADEIGPPTWASDVSPALGEFQIKATPPSGPLAVPWAAKPPPAQSAAPPRQPELYRSTIENSIRVPLPRPLY